MMSVNLKSLVDKMTPTLRQSLEGAAGLCLSQTQYNVELEHWVAKLLEQQDSDLYLLLEKHEINLERLNKQLITAISRFKSGSSRPAALSPDVVTASKNAWLLTSVEYQQHIITSGHLLAAVLLDEQQRRQLCENCPALRELAAESLRNTAGAIFGQTAETANLSPALSADTDPAKQTAKASKSPSLDKYTVNLTEKAVNGEIDPVLGRDEEIRQCIDILTRRRQNNPIMTGEAGVGKTAVVEGFALKISQGDVPPPLRNVALRTLDLGLLQAGASVKGEFENRLKSVIDEVKASPTPIILFIDEAHTMIGAGGKEGQGDAANLLKPALARGELRTIAATTWAEYKKYFERDPALTRRFQVVKVEEPDEEKAINMMRGIAETLQQHHNVRILDEAIVASVQLSHRYIPARQLPDKSVSLLDTACARVALSQNSTPALIEDATRRIETAERTQQRLARENAATSEHQEQLTELDDEISAAQQLFTELTDQLSRERAIIDSIDGLRTEIEQQFDLGNAMPELQQQLQQLNSELEDIQQQRPLSNANVDKQAIADVIANWTGIPIGKMVGDEITAIETLADTLGHRVIGQPHALEAVAQAVRTNRAGLTDPRKPVGVFLFAGTSGVGKTETALALADTLYGGENNITTINMSEFKEEHKISMLLGSPPGYVGFGEGGVLTEAARRKPYSVILLDEMEKAHPGVQDIFYNLFDKGTIKDGEGRDIDFKNTLIIMTSNAGEDAIKAIFNQVEEKPEPDVLVDNIRPYLLQCFKPAFLGRANVIAYYPLDDENLIEIAKINMGKIENRVKSHYGAEFSYDEDSLLQIVARCQEADTGARNIENILNKTILPQLASECLQKLAQEEPISNIHISTTEDGEFGYVIS